MPASAVADLVSGSGYSSDQAVECLTRVDPDPAGLILVFIGGSRQVLERSLCPMCERLCRYAVRPPLVRDRHDELEERVRERTAKLSSANESLRVEMAERQRIEQERTQLLIRLVYAQEDERRRIARELHDQLGQQLTALRLTLEILKAQSVERTDLCAQVATLEELALQLDQDVAFRVGELRPTVLEGGLRALINYVRNWSKHFGIRARLHTSRATDERLTPEMKTMIYRLAQEQSAVTTRI